MFLTALRFVDPTSTHPSDRTTGTRHRFGGQPTWQYLLALAVFAGCSAPPPDAPATPDSDVVVPGVEVLLRDSVHLVRGQRVGLITNRSGVGRDGTSSIDLLHRSTETDLVALFAPEHGIRGTEPEGRALADAVDEQTGLPIYSLYGEHRAPTTEMLSEIDVLAFDLQDIGTRYYTYVSTMAVSMQAAGAAGTPFVVLDRPNPIGGATQGPVLDPDYSTFVGLYPVPVRHGMTVGELARLFVGAFDIDVDLHVVPADGWDASRWADETGLPWIAPSLNMPSLESATHYPGTCLYEGTNLSVGRGTPEAFQVLGAPWIDGAEWAARLNALGTPGVRVEAITFRPESPSDGKFAGEELSGIRLTVTDRGSYDPIRTGVASLTIARALAGDQWAWNERHFDRLIGTDHVRLAIERGDTPEAIMAEWDAELSAFESLRAPYLIYPR